MSRMFRLESLGFWQHSKNLHGTACAQAVFWLTIQSLRSVAVFCSKMGSSGAFSHFYLVGYFVLRHPSQQCQGKGLLSRMRARSEPGRWQDAVDDPVYLLGEVA
ncbi:hypothetical protein BS17DRAFT_447474 [Gyrodon lividus]|nr:hypothetical protein BS17DRAFT_447474 [Gyrodon lividus]